LAHRAGLRPAPVGSAQATGNRATPKCRPCNRDPEEAADPGWAPDLGTEALAGLSRRLRRTAHEVRRGLPALNPREVADALAVAEDADAYRRLVHMHACLRAWHARLADRRGWRAAGRAMEVNVPQRECNAPRTPGGGA
ncbi:hypothetical protein OOK44_37905, partial [Streptomyces cellulosae]|nr:hypothetical protein [Streptomyces cellulosae]